MEGMDLNSLLVNGGIAIIAFNQAKALVSSIAAKFSGGGPQGEVIRALGRIEDRQREANQLLTTHVAKFNARRNV